MRGHEFLDKMELIDPAYVEAADAEPKTRKNVWVKWGVAAACFAFVVLVGTRLSLWDILWTSSDLPMLSISDGTSPTGYGYEGNWAYDISELKNANPWREDMELSTLPVYKNPLTYDESFTATNVNFNQMEELLLDVAARIGIDKTDEEAMREMIEKRDSPGWPTLVLKSDGVEIIVEQTLSAQIDFDPAIALPEEYNFSFYASYDDIVIAAEYLKTAYSNLIGTENQQVNIYDGAYDVYERQSYLLSFFDAAGSETEQIINYNFHQVKFFGSEDGAALRSVRINQPDLSQKVGDYPIISAEQARELLLSGSYITTVPYEIAGSEYVKKVELIYRTGDYEEYFMPYYLFYVEVPEEEWENGMKTYGYYYVPAVNSAYLPDVSTWDGILYF